jgi:hypothetical protein
MTYERPYFTYYAIEKEEDGKTTYIWFKNIEDELTVKRETVDTEVFNTIVNRQSGIYGMDFHAEFGQVIRKHWGFQPTYKDRDQLDRFIKFLEQDLKDNYDSNGEPL